MSVRYYLFLMTALVTLIPVAVFGIWPHSKAYDDIIANVSERNLLIAQNLSRALERYDRDLKATFQLLIRNVVENSNANETEVLLDNLEFRHVCIAERDTRRVRYSITGNNPKCPALVPESRMTLFKEIAAVGTPMFSGVMPGPDGEPTIFLIGEIDGMIAIGAVRTSYFVALGKEIAFGERGHAAIVDKGGRILAHPLDQWREEMRDISSVSAVQYMMAGKTGVAQFYSPALKGDMIAGYTSVRGPGWGVMVPQPISELKVRAEKVRNYAFGVIVAGVVAAALVSWLVSGYMTRRIQAVSNAARAVAEGDSEARAGSPSALDPTELSELSEAFNIMAEQVAKSSREQREALARAEAANRAKTDFLASISHELRTPLNAILGFSEAIKSEVFGPVGNEKYREYADDIHQSGSHLHALIADILDMSKIEAGLTDLDESWIHLEDVISKCLTLVEFRALARGVVFQRPENASLWRLRADERLLVQVLLNLFSNAVKFSHHGGSVDILANERGDGSFEVSVQDRGIGIKPEQIDRAFEPFWQAISNEENSREGIGLGLAIVSQLMKLHGGTVRMEPREGGGTVVTIAFPSKRIRRAD